MGEKGPSPEAEPRAQDRSLVMLNLFPGTDLRRLSEALVTEETKALVLIGDAGGGMGEENIRTVGELVAKGLAVIILPENANQKWGMAHFPDQPAQNAVNLGATYIEAPSDIEAVYGALSRGIDQGLTGQELATHVRGELALPVDAPRPLVDPNVRMERFQQKLEADGLAGDWKEMPTSQQLCSSITEALALFKDKDPESHRYLETVILPELSEALNSFYRVPHIDLDITTETVMYLKNKLSELEGQIKD